MIYPDWLMTGAGGDTFIIVAGEIMANIADQELTVSLSDELIAILNDERIIAEM